MAARVLGASAAAAAAALVSAPASNFFGGSKAPLHSGPVTEASALISARGIVNAAHCGFVCTGGDGAPDCRIMDVKGPLDDAMRFSLVSRDFTRKARQLKRDPRCTLAFHDPRSGGESGYLSLTGTVREVTAAVDRRALWKDSWTLYHTAPEVAESDVLVWEFTPERMELLDNDRWLRADWAPVTLRREGARWVPAATPRRAQ